MGEHSQEKGSFNHLDKNSEMLIGFFDVFNKPVGPLRSARITQQFLLKGTRAIWLRPFVSTFPSI